MTVIYHAVMGLSSGPVVLYTHLCLVDEDAMRQFVTHFTGRGGQCICCFLLFFISVTLSIKIGNSISVAGLVIGEPTRGQFFPD